VEVPAELAVDAERRWLVEQLFELDAMDEQERDVSAGEEWTKNRRRSPRATAGARREALGEPCGWDLPVDGFEKDAALVVAEEVLHAGQAHPHVVCLLVDSLQAVVGLVLEDEQEMGVTALLAGRDMWTCPAYHLP